MGVWVFTTTLELDLRQTDRVELVTGLPELDTNYDNGDSDYDNTDDIQSVSSASTTTSSIPRIVCSDDDFIMECSSDRNVKICGKQFCDRVVDCPNGEDENPEQCQPGELPMVPVLEVDQMVNMSDKMDNNQHCPKINKNIFFW